MGIDAYNDSRAAHAGAPPERSVDDIAERQGGEDLTARSPAWRAPPDRDAARPAGHA